MKLDLFLRCVVAAAALTPGWTQKVETGSLVVQDFEARVKAYVKLQKQEEAGLPALKPADSTVRIALHEHKLADRIRRVRYGVPQGNIFTPEIAAEFRRLIALAMQGKNAGQVDQSLQHAEPTKHEKHGLRINEAYPVPGVPLQSTPPTLLLNLPALPPELDYRVVGHNLVLRDAKANLIVDFVPNAVP
jgi:hypothetical protein